MATERLTKLLYMFIWRLIANISVAFLQYRFYIFLLTSMVTFRDIIMWTLLLGLSSTAQKCLNKVNGWFFFQNILKLHCIMLIGTTSFATFRNRQWIEKKLKGIF